MARYTASAIVRVVTGLVFVASIVGAGDDIDQTHGFKNGHLWQKENETWKLGFVMGYNDAYGFSPAFYHCKDGSDGPTPRPTGITNGDLIHAVDHFYNIEPTNIRIPIAWVVIYEMELFKGKTEAELKSLLDSIHAASQ